MKSKKQQIFEKILRFMAKTVLWKYKPRIIGITGSVGKTSAKEAVFAVLFSHFRTRKNEKNYNNEIGIPLTVIGVETGGRSFWKWLWIFFKWLSVMIFPVNYPEVLVLEMGVDRPRDMENLLSFIKPEAGIITNISGSHLEYFKSVDNIAREKEKLVKSLPENGMAILNGDDEKVAAMRNKLKVPFLTFGFGDVAAVRATDIAFNYHGALLEGISFKLNYEGKIIPVRLPSVLASHLMYAALAAIAAGIYFKINLVDIAGALENFHPPLSRMNLISGIKNSFLIDDTYNSSPTSATAALNVLEEIKSERKIAVLGDMLELGEESNKKHQDIIKKAVDNKTDTLILVGQRMKKAGSEMAELHNFSGKIFFFSDPMTAGRKLQDEIRSGDLILVKGSQGMRMEKIVREVMAEPLRAEKLICRQSPDWLMKPYIQP